MIGGADAPLWRLRPRWLFPDTGFNLLLDLGILAEVQPRQQPQTTLVVIVTRQLEGNARQQQDGDQVGYRHQGHGEIGHFPDEGQLRQRAEHHHAQRTQA